MKKVRMFGPLSNNSGYGNAIGNFAEAFAKSDIPTKFNFPKTRMKYVTHLDSYEGKTNTDFYLHCPPYKKHKSNNYKIGYFYWEADTIPKYWAKSLNTLNELWVPCDLVKRACLKAKFRKKIKVVPTPIRKFNLNNKISIPAHFSNDYILSENVFKFYAIFQWHERKGYKELLKSYLSEFTVDDNVVLILKVNPLKIPGYQSQDINKEILKIKRYLNKSNFPPIFLSKKIVKKEDIYALHNIGDCYVSPHHGEGWGMSIHDAMYAKSHIITTKFGGITEFLNDDSANLIDYVLKPVTGMDWSPLYGSYQKWAYPSPRHLSSLMKKVYKESDKLKYKLENAKKIALTMDIDSVSKIINKELK